MPHKDSPVEYIELNISNYDCDDVSQLNEWGIWAWGEIQRLRSVLEELTTYEVYPELPTGPITPRDMADIAARAIDGGDPDANA